MGMISRADAYQQQHRWAGLPLAVLYKFTDDQGSYLAAQITYYGVVSLFPLLLLLTTFLGYGLHGSRHFQRQVLDSALAQFPVVGDQIARNIHSFHGSVPGLVIGIFGCVYGGLGIVQATQNALNKVWGVPRNARHNPIKARLRSLLLLSVGGGSVIVTTVLTALGAAANDYGASFGVTVRVTATSLAVALNVAMFMVAFRVLTARQVTIREIRAGAIAAAVAWQALQVGGALLLGSKLKGATATYGLFAIVLGLLAWVYVGAATVVMCAEFNAVRAGQMWPRSLLAPFTDNVELTPGDVRAYTSYAKTELHKGFETIDVSFGKPPAARQQPDKSLAIPSESLVSDSGDHGDDEADRDDELGPQVGGVVQDRSDWRAARCGVAEGGQGEQCRGHPAQGRPGQRAPLADLNPGSGGNRQGQCPHD
jgi:membrane protein